MTKPENDLMTSRLYISMGYNHITVHIYTAYVEAPSPGKIKPPSILQISYTEMQSPKFATTFKTKIVIFFHMISPKVHQNPTNLKLKKKKKV